jgi:hypothetical protein
MADSPVATGSLRFVLFAPVGWIDRRAAVGFEEKIGDNGVHHYFDAPRAATSTNIKFGIINTPIERN